MTIHTHLIAPIGTLLGRQARERPDQVAFEDRHRSVTYAALHNRTAELAGHLQRMGVRPGERVAVMLPNSVGWIEACLAILRAGGIAVPISADATEAEATYRLDDAGCVACFADVATAPVAGPLLGAERVVLCTEAGAAPMAGGQAEAPRDPQDLHAPAFIVYTSGTTGRPKGVVLSLHGNLWIVAACWAPIAGLSGADRMLSALPLFHSYALNLTALAIVATGASVYLMERFSTDGMLDLMERRDFTVVPAVPTVFHYMLQAARSSNRRIAGSLRLCLSAGAILPGTLNRDFEAFFGVKLLDGYGITETSTMVTLNAPEGARVMGSCGLPVPGLSVRLLDPATGRDVAAGEAGELVVRGPGVMLGYHDDPRATAAALRDGWYHTGDLARQDENGFLTITGRLKEIIIRGGQNIAPAEVEEALASHPGVLDCAVAGLPDPALGEVPVAFLMLRDGMALDEAGLAEHCRALLSAYKMPAAYHVVDAIPRTGSGKTMRFKLVEAIRPRDAAVVATDQESVLP